MLSELKGCAQILRECGDRLQAAGSVPVDELLTIGMVVGEMEAIAEKAVILIPSAPAVVPPGTPVVPAFKAAQEAHAAPAAPAAVATTTEPKKAPYQGPPRRKFEKV